MRCDVGGSRLRLCLIGGLALGASCSGDTQPKDVTPTDTAPADATPIPTGPDALDPPGPATKLEFAVSDVEVATADKAAGLQGKLVADPATTTLYYAYLKYDGPLAIPGKSCDIAVFGGGPAPSSSYSLRVAHSVAGGAWAVERVPLEAVPAANNVAAIGARFGLDATLDAQGNLVIVFAGGGPGLATCASSDLVLARRTAVAGQSDGAWSFTVPVTSSAACCDAVDCGGDPFCRNGTDVGAWAAVDRRSDGTLGIAYTDYHNFWDNDGQSKQGLELVEGTSVTGIDPWSGSGAFATLRYVGATPIVAYTRYGGGGLIVRRRTGTSGHVTDWQEKDLYPGAAVGERPSLAVAKDGSLGLAAYVMRGTHGEALDDLLYCTSADGGVTWKVPCEKVDSLGTVGQNPSLAFDSRSWPVIAYYYCGTAGDCTAASDGLRLAWRDGDKKAWKRFNVHFDNSTKSGLYAGLVLDASDTPTLTFHDVTRGAAMVARGTLSGGTP